MRTSEEEAQRRAIRRAAKEATELAHQAALAANKVSRMASEYGDIVEADRARDCARELTQQQRVIDRICKVNSADPFYDVGYDGIRVWPIGE